jgi:hypothetical protein
MHRAFVGRQAGLSGVGFEPGTKSFTDMQSIGDILSSRKLI